MSTAPTILPPQHLPIDLKKISSSDRQKAGGGVDRQAANWLVGQFLAGKMNTLHLDIHASSRRALVGMNIGIAPLMV